MKASSSRTNDKAMADSNGLMVLRTRECGRMASSMGLGRTPPKRGRCGMASGTWVASSTGSQGTELQSEICAPPPAANFNTFKSIFILISLKNFFLAL